MQPIPASAGSRSLHRDAETPVPGAATRDGPLGLHQLICVVHAAERELRRLRGILRGRTFLVAGILRKVAGDIAGTPDRPNSRLTGERGSPGRAPQPAGARHGGQPASSRTHRRAPAHRRAGPRSQRASSEASARRLIATMRGVVIADPEGLWNTIMWDRSGAGHILRRSKTSGPCTDAAGGSRSAMALPCHPTVAAGPGVAAQPRDYSSASREPRLRAGTSSLGSAPPDLWQSPSGGADASPLGGTEAGNGRANRENPQHRVRRRRNEGGLLKM